MRIHSVSYAVTRGRRHASEVRAKAIGEPPYPNWTAVGVTWLAGFDFEIKVIARLPSAA